MKGITVIAFLSSILFAVMALYDRHITGDTLSAIYHLVFATLMYIVFEFSKGFELHD